MKLTLKTLPRFEEDKFDRNVRIFRYVLEGATLRAASNAAGAGTAVGAAVIKKMTEVISLYGKHMQYAHPYSIEKYPYMWHHTRFDKTDSPQICFGDITTADLRAEKAYWFDMLERFVKFQKMPPNTSVLNEGSSAALLNLSFFSYRAIEKIFTRRNKDMTIVPESLHVTVGQVVDVIQKAPHWTPKTEIQTGLSKVVHEDIKQELKKRGFDIDAKPGTYSMRELMAKALDLIEHAHMYNNHQRRTIIHLLREATKE